MLLHHRDGTPRVFYHATRSPEPFDLKDFRFHENYPAVHFSADRDYCLRHAAASLCGWPAPTWIPEGSDTRGLFRVYLDVSYPMLYREELQEDFDIFTQRGMDIAGLKEKRHDGALLRLDFDTIEAAVFHPRCILPIEQYDKFD